MGGGPGGGRHRWVGGGIGVERWRQRRRLLLAAEGP